MFDEDLIRRRDEEINKWVFRFFVCFLLLVASLVINLHLLSQ